MQSITALLAPKTMPTASPLCVDVPSALSQLGTLIERAGHRYCLVGDPEAQRRSEGGDFDIAISTRRLPAILAILNRFASEHGWEILQRIGHEKSAWYFVLGRFGPDREWRLLKLDFCHDFSRNARFYMSADELLEKRSPSAGGIPFSVPAAASNFAYCLVKAIDKQSLNTTRAQILSRLWLEDPAGCRQALKGFWRDDEIEQVATAGAGGLWETIIREQKDYRHSLHRHRPVSWSGWLAEITLRAKRILRPPGFIVAITGGPADVRLQLLDRLVHAFQPAFYGVRTIPPPFRRGFISTLQLRVLLARGHLLIAPSWPLKLPPPARHGVCFLLADGALPPDCSGAWGRAVLLRPDQSVDRLARTAIATVADRLAARMKRWTPASSLGGIPS